PVRLRELVVLAVASGTRCTYLSVQHGPIAIAAGAPPEQLAAVAEQRSGGRELDATEAAAGTAAFELVTPHTPAPGALAAPRARVLDRQVIEIVSTTGYYVMLAGLMNGLAVDVAPSAEHFLGLVGGDPD